MQTLEIDYDLSFFDTDPYEPLPGGTMSIWPFMMGHFVELPYTLSQDHTLMVTLAEQTPRMWLEKVEFIRKYHGLALVNTHPDYLRNPKFLSIYETFLKSMSERRDYWHALPKDAANWWRTRTSIKISNGIISKDNPSDKEFDFSLGNIQLMNDGVISI